MTNRPVEQAMAGQVRLLLGTFGPLVAALWLVFRQGGAASTTELMRSGFRASLSWPVLLVVLVLPLPAAAASNWWAGIHPTRISPWTLAGTFVLYFFLGGSFAEEFGWRGYAWPRLRARVGFVEP